jgi:hypothetical protein
MYWQQERILCSCDTRISECISVDNAGRLWASGGHGVYHLYSDFAVGCSSTRVDCTLVPALLPCENTAPMLDVENPILATTKVAE